MISEQPKIDKKPWGRHEGKAVFLFRLQNVSGAFLEITNYGATLVSAWVPDRQGVYGNVVLGFPSLEGYLKDTCYIGSTIGRFANRIGGASFMLDGQTYQLDRNDGINNNHGGLHGFHSKVFEATIQNNELVLTYISPDGEGGFPANLVFRVAYSWNNSNELLIRYSALADTPTICNFTNHAYFNLSAGEETIEYNQLSIASSRVLETTAQYIPTGEILPARDLSFVADRLVEKFTFKGEKQHGLNTYYIFDDQLVVAPVCTLIHESSGRSLQVFTSYPGVQLYTGDYLQSEMQGLHGRKYQPFDGLCLECQYFPDSPNHSHFPAVVLGPGQQYNEYIKYQFSVE